MTQMPARVSEQIADLKPFTSSLITGLIAQAVGVIILTFALAFPAPETYSASGGPNAGAMVVGLLLIAVGAVVGLVGLARLLNGIFAHLANARWDRPQR